MSESTNPFSNSCIPEFNNPYEGSVDSDSNNIGVNSDAVIWMPDPASGATCMQAVTITQLAQWLEWVEKNIIQNNCYQRQGNCRVLVGQDYIELAKAISDCIGLTDRANIVVKKGSVVDTQAGLVGFGLNCVELLQMIRDCFAIAFLHEPANKVLGWELDSAGNTELIEKYNQITKTLTVLSAELSFYDNRNRFAAANPGDRLMAHANRVVHDNTNSSSFITDNATFTAAIDGWYEMDINVQVMLKYAANPSVTDTPAIKVLMGAVQRFSEANKNAVEYRIDQDIRWARHGTQQPCGLKGTLLVYMSAGDTLTPRFWLDHKMNNPVEMQIGSGSINKWTIHQLPDYENAIAG